jgi:hypothetical protein
VQQSGATIPNTLRSLRVFYIALLVSALIYGFLLRLIPASTTHLPSSYVLRAAGTLTFMIFGGGYLARLIYVKPALETLRTSPEDAGALVRWRLGSILSAVFAESAALLGVMIHLVGVPDTQSAILIVAGVAMMLLWWPRKP